MLYASAGREVAARHRAREFAVAADADVLSATARRAVEAAVLDDVAKTARQLARERR
jgi:hypothetical protein